MQKRSRVGLALIGAIALALTVASPASAQAGDVTYNHNSTYSELGSNQCSVASFNTFVGGGPFPASTTMQATLQGYKSTCKIRVRFSYMTSVNGTNLISGYYYLSGANLGGTPQYQNVYRCYTEVGVRRNDGTYYTRFQISNSAAQAGCPG